MNNLKRILRELNIKQKDIGEYLNIKSNSTVSLKINGKAQFSVGEFRLLKELINNKSKKKYSYDDLLD